MRKRSLYLSHKLTPIIVRSTADVFFRSSGWRPADDRTEAGPICSIGRRPDKFQVSLKILPDVGPREGIELRSKQDRTINARVSPGDRPTSDSSNVYRQKKWYFPETYTSAGDRLMAGGPPHGAQRRPDDARYDTRTMNPMSGARRAITIR
ncbi:hypothetical protein DPMN_149860 [Dreissena polymorpha]|uniref:Uncharacterized protein n=1 Tax=Dreissena polymorpha TaxID=45954 RepID=A0A9D4FEA8_DREPO|nr:hypothetical protein DPMN_149860 [Dreissena polymorpha]